jgi:hypothetical protein
MSHPVVNCAKCGRPKAPPVTTQQAPGEAKWPTYWADIQYMMRKILDARRGEPVTINGQRLGVPDPPPWVASDESVTVNENRRGVPPLPPLVPPKEPVA